MTPRSDSDKQLLGQQRHVSIPRPGIKLFPFSFPDELHASQASRFHVNSGNATTRRSFIELYDSAPFKLTQWIPPYLDRFAGKLPGALFDNLVDMLRNNTVFPLFETFCNTRVSLPADLRAVGDAISNMPKRIVGKSGDTHLCLDCLGADLREHGWPYLHRAHQAPGVTVCWRHGTPLLSACPFCGRPFEPEKDLILVPWQDCAGCGQALSESSFYTSPPDPPGPQIGYAQFVHEMLMASRALTTQTLAQMYRYRIAELGLTRGTQIDHRAVLAAIEDHYGRASLARLDAAYEKGPHRHWLRMFNVGTQNDVPLTRHLLVASFLFGTAQLFWKHADLATERQAKMSKQPRRPAAAQQQSKAPTVPLADASDAIADTESLHPARSVIAAALRENPGWTKTELWRYRKGAMKDLHRNDEAGPAWLDRLLASTTKNDAELPAQGGVETSSNEDVRWAQRLASKAIELYATKAMPVKVTRNHLMREAGWKAGPLDPQRFPLARAQLESMHESDWHFYARRILWAKLTGGAKAGWKIVEQAGVEWHRGQILMAFFSDVPSNWPLEIGSIANILATRDISKHWQGPVPERIFDKRGRNYVAQRKHQTPPTPLIAVAL